MIRIISFCLAVAAASVLFVVTDLSAQSDPAAIVTERQELMRSNSKAFGPLVAVIKGESTDLAAAVAAAQAMNDGTVKAASLFPVGTAKGEVPGSRAKPEIWTQPAEFEAAAQALINETAKLVIAANSGDLDAFKAQFNLVAEACGGCHEGKDTAGGKFRFPKDE